MHKLKWEIKVTGNRQLRVLTIGAMLALGVGCVSQKEAMIKDGYPEAYADGFEDGCHSGKKAGGNMFEAFKKDVRRFDAQKDYAQGWSDAFRQCETEQEALDRKIRTNIELQRLDSDRKAHFEQDVLKGIDTSGLENLK
jgi:hypothetical protein